MRCYFLLWTISFRSWLLFSSLKKEKKIPYVRNCINYLSGLCICFYSRTASFDDCSFVLNIESKADISGVPIWRTSSWCPPGSENGMIILLSWLLELIFHNKMEVEIWQLSSLFQRCSLCFIWFWCLLHIIGYTLYVFTSFLRIRL